MGCTVLYNEKLEMEGTPQVTWDIFSARASSVVPVSVPCLVFIFNHALLAQRLVSKSLVLCSLLSIDLADSGLDFVENIHSAVSSFLFGHTRGLAMKNQGLRDTW